MTIWGEGRGQRSGDIITSVDDKEAFYVGWEGMVCVKG